MTGRFTLKWRPLLDIRFTTEADVYLLDSRSYLKHASVGLNNNTAAGM